MEKKCIWMVEWSDNYVDHNAAFSEKERAINYIETQACLLGLHSRGFNLVEESILKEDDGKPSWGVYAFYPEAEFGETDVQFVSFTRYWLDVH